MIYRRLSDGSVIPDPECLKKRKKLNRCNWGKAKKEKAARAIRLMMNAAKEKLKGERYGIF